MCFSGDKGGAVVTGASALSSYSANELVAQGIIDKMINHRIKPLDRQYSKIVAGVRTRWQGQPYQLDESWRSYLED